MRCPKCGYNSFDHLENCSKCGKNLVEHKSRFGIKSILLSKFSIGAKKLVEEEESIETSAPLQADQSAAKVSVEAPVAESESDDISFDFMGGNEEEEDLPFDELFEESSIEDDMEETLPAPDSSVNFMDDGLDDPSAFDLDDPGKSGYDYSLDEPDEFGDDDTTGTKEDPNRPFDCKEVLQTLEPPTSNTTDNLKNSDDLFISGDDFQEELFSAGEEFPPLSSTEIEEQSLESLETTYGKGTFDPTPIDASDTFALGGLPSTDFSDSPKNDISTFIKAVEPTEDTTSGKEQNPPQNAAFLPPPFGRRISAFFCDVVLIGLVSFCFIIVAESALSKNTDGFIPSLNTLVDLSIPYFLVIFCLTFGYSTLFHFLTGQTPGKMATAIRVETISGESLFFSQTFMRSVGGLIQILPAGLGYLSVLLNKEGRGWNDRLAGTQLVDLKKLPEALEIPVA